MITQFGHRPVVIWPSDLPGQRTDVQLPQNSIRYRGYRGSAYCCEDTTQRHRIEHGRLRITGRLTQCPPRRLRVATARHTRLRRGVLRLSRALAGLGVIPAPLNAWAYDESARLTPLTVSADRPNEAAAILPVWRALADRWRATTTLAPKTREIYHSQVLQVGRWATATYGDGADPACWTREMAAACVAMILQKRCGDWTPAATRSRLVDPGRPLQPRSQLHFLNAICAFFRDCQEWEWMPRRLDAARAFAQPRSIRALIGPQPRVLSDDVWAKLLWAGLNLAEADLPPAWVSRHFYPLTMIRAVAVVWLFGGLRQDEIRRLRIGCIRFSPAAIPPASEAVCLLDVPVNKTSTAFTKPVDRAVAEAIQAWEQARPTQPLALDEKTAELVHFLFSVRCARFSPHYLNRTLIPALCRKAGLPLADARGRITSHRARSTIATQLFNARQPLSFFELQAWLGHSTPHTTQHYARVAPTKLARAYTDAAYFQRNLRMIDVLIDQEAVRAGPAAGEPWRFYDLGHGYCTYDFFDQCPHRMACAKCAFYRPKGSAAALFLEGKAGLLRLKQDIPLTEAEAAAVEDGVTAFDALLKQLTDIPTPAGPTPRQLLNTSAPAITDERRA
jgi:integrase